MKRIVFTIIVCVCAALPLAAQTAAPEGMVQIPAGKFWMGRTTSSEMEAANKMPRGWRDDRPANHIQLDAFYLDKYEVTNADYAKFLQATVMLDVELGIAEVVFDLDLQTVLHGIRTVPDHCSGA